MSTPVRDLFMQASTLDDQDRATLTALLLESLEHEVDEDIETAWLEEIEQRLLEMDAGSINLIPWKDVKEKLKNRPGGKHPD